MNRENPSSDEDLAVGPECTRPVLTDPDEVHAILHELLRRTTDMERRLDRLLDQRRACSIRVHSPETDEERISNGTSRGVKARQRMSNR